MSIPESVVRSVNAASVDGASSSEAEACARRVILALAENMPRGSLLEAGTAALMAANNESDWNDIAREAIATFLKHVAGDQP